MISELIILLQYSVCMRLEPIYRRFHKSHREIGCRINCGKFRFCLWDESFVRKKRRRIGRSGNKRTIEPRLMGDNRHCCLHHFSDAIVSPLFRSKHAGHFITRCVTIIVWPSFSFVLKDLRLPKKIANKYSALGRYRITVRFKFSLSINIYNIRTIFYRCIVEKNWEKNRENSKVVQIIKNIFECVL